MSVVTCPLLSAGPKSLLLQCLMPGGLPQSTDQ